MLIPVLLIGNESSARARPTAPDFLAISVPALCPDRKQCHGNKPRDRGNHPFPFEIIETVEGQLREVEESVEGAYTYGTFNAITGEGQE